MLKCTRSEPTPGKHVPYTCARGPCAARNSLASGDMLQGHEEDGAKGNSLSQSETTASTPAVPGDSQGPHCLARWSPMACSGRRDGSSCCRQSKSPPWEDVANGCCHPKQRLADRRSRNHVSKTNKKALQRCP